MRDFLAEKLLLNTQHGLDCTVEVCKAGYPDDDELIFKGAAGDCLRFIFDYELPADGDSYFSFTTDMENYVGYNFDDIALRLGFVPQELSDMLGCQQAVDGLIHNAAQRSAVSKAGGFAGTRNSELGIRECIRE